MARTAAFLVAPSRHCVADVQKGCSCHFRTLFLWFISFGGAKEMNKTSSKTKNEKKLLLLLPDFYKQIS
jgi:hypothetical protein